MEDAGSVDDDDDGSHPWLARLVKLFQTNQKLARSLSDLDVVTQDRTSFVAHWQQILDAAKKFEGSGTLVSKQLEDDARLNMKHGLGHWPLVPLLWIASVTLVQHSFITTH